MLDLIHYLKELKMAIEQNSDLIYSHAPRHKPGGADALFPAGYDINPSADNTYNLGSSSYRWANLYAVTLHGSLDWSDIVNTPSCFTPCTHGREAHSISLIPSVTSDPSSPSEGDFWYNSNDDILRLYTTATKQVFPADWGDITSKPSCYTPCAHTHTLYIGDGSSTKISYASNTRLNLVAGTYMSLSYDDTYNKVTFNVSGITSDTYKVKADSNDGSPDYLSGKVDGSTILEDSTNHYIKVGSVPWSSITSKPSCFTPCAHESTHEPGGSDALFPAGYDINPSADNTYNLGSSSYRWANLYAVTLHGSLDWSDIVNTPSCFTPCAHASTHASGGSDPVSLDASQITSGTFDSARIPWGSVGASIVPSSSGSYDLGSSSYYWNKLYVDGISSAGDIIPTADGTKYLGSSSYRWLILAKNIVTDTFSASFRPSSDNSYDMGTSSYRWANIYVVTLHQGDTIYDNGWRLTEGEKVGIDSPLVLISPDGKKYRFNLTEVS